MGADHLGAGRGDEANHLDVGRGDGVTWKGVGGELRFGCGAVWQPQTLAAVAHDCPGGRSAAGLFLAWEREHASPRGQPPPRSAVKATTRHGNHTRVTGE